MPSRRAILAAALALPSLARAQATPTIRLMINPAGTMSLIPHVIRRAGLERRHGYALQVVPYTSNAAAQSALQGRNADVAILDWLVTARLWQGGVPLVGVAPFLTYVNSVMVPANSPIQDMGGIAGRRMGVAGRTSFDWAMMVATGKRFHNVDLDRQATIQDAAAPLLRAAITNGQLDATHMWNSLVPDMLVGGRFRTLTTIRALTERFGIPTAPFLFFGMRQEFEQANPRLATAMAATWRDVAEVLATDDEAWTEGARPLNLGSEALALFREQVRRDMLRSFTPEMAPALAATYDIVRDVLGAEALGFERVPPGMLSLAYQ